MSGRELTTLRLLVKRLSPLAIASSFYNQWQRELYFYQLLTDCCSVIATVFWTVLFIVQLFVD